MVTLINLRDFAVTEPKCDPDCIPVLLDHAPPLRGDSAVLMTASWPLLKLVFFVYVHVCVHI